MAVSSPTFAAPDLGMPPKTAMHSVSPGPQNLAITVPLFFMATGILSLVAGMILLVLRPEMLATYHYNQYVIGVTHLFVLGWICTIVMGSLYQLVPVALETTLYSHRLARWQFLFHVVGFVGMVWMFWTWNMKQVGHFGSIFAAGVVLFVYNMVRTLLRVRRWNAIGVSVASALVWLSLAVLAGLTLAASKSSYQPESGAGASGVAGSLVRGVRHLASLASRFDQISAMHAHAHLAGLGVFVLLIVGVSYKLVPMFALSEVQNTRRAMASVLLINAGLLGVFVSVLIRHWSKFAFAAIIITGFVLYGIELLAILRARKRRALDWGVRGFLTAVGLLAPLSLLALVLSWPGLPLTNLTGQMENLYGFLVFLGLVTFAIVGMLYKIIPFLVWYGVYGRQVGLYKVPSLAQLYSSKIQGVGYWSYLAGLLITSIAILAPEPSLVRLGCIVLLSSLGCLATNVAKILTHLMHPKLEPLAAKPTHS